MAEVDTFELKVRSFLHFCRVEKGLSVNTLEAYRRDLAALGQWLGRPSQQRQLAAISLDDFRQYLDDLRARKLANRSIARQVTTLRGFFGFLLEEGNRGPVLMHPAKSLAHGIEQDRIAR